MTSNNCGPSRGTCLIFITSFKQRGTDCREGISEGARLGILVVVVVMVVLVRVVLLLLMVAFAVAVASAATSVDDAAPVQPRVPRAGLLVPADAADAVHATAAVEPLPA